MVTKKQKNLILGIGILLTIVAIVVYGQFFTIIGQGDVVYLPEYASVWCAPCDVGVQTKLDSIKTSSFSEEYRKYQCTAKEIGGGYLPNGCNFEIETSGGVGEIGAYVCNKNIDESKVKLELEREITPFKSGSTINGCSRYGDSDFPSDLKKNIKTAQIDENDNFINQILYLMTEQDTEVKYDYTPFCLRTLERGQLSSKSSCSNEHLVSSTKDIPNGVPKFVPTGVENSIENTVIEIGRASCRERV